MLLLKRGAEVLLASGYALQRCQLLLYRMELRAQVLPPGQGSAVRGPTLAGRAVSGRGLGRTKSSQDRLWIIACGPREKADLLGLRLKRERVPVRHCSSGIELAECSLDRSKFFLGAFDRIATAEMGRIDSSHEVGHDVADRRIAQAWTLFTRPRRNIRRLLTKYR